MTVSIAPSILSADFLRLGQEIKAVEAAGADLLHIDVMDGHFVPNLTIGPTIVKAIKSMTSLPLDVHLMIENPDLYIPPFADAGGDGITVHVETGYHLFRTIDLIKSYGKRAGVALNPATPLTAVEDVLSAIDLLLIMTVNPGFGGQHYIPSMTRKIERARHIVNTTDPCIELEVDGGVKAENIRMLVQAGASIVVMGTAIFPSDDYVKKIGDIRKRLE